MNNIFYKTIQDLEKQKKLYADCKIVHNNIKINKYLLNINVRSEILRLIHSNFSENSNYILSKNYIKVLFFQNNYFIYLIFLFNGNFKEDYSYDLYNLVISGPDGVGKSFIINKLNKTFNFLKDEFSVNHHIIRIKNRDGNKIYLTSKIINKVLLNFLSILKFEFTYKKNLNDIFLNNLKNGLSITERFYIDRLVIFKLLNKNLLSYLFIRYIFKYPTPNGVLLLNADKDKIFKNKKELSPDLISLYNPLMRKYLEKFNLNYLELNNLFNEKTFEEIINFIISENLKFLIVAIEKRVKI